MAKILLLISTHARSLFHRLLQRLIDWRDHPDLLRRTLRDSTPGQIFACAGLGLVVGAAIVLIHETLDALHQGFFALQSHERLSAAGNIPINRLLLVPILGGLCVALLRATAQKLKLHDIVDPIEANAVHGGRLSLRDSARLLLASMVSSASGVSVGMEAAYAQLGGAVLSFGGKLLHLRREDSRIFVAAGAAAAIAAAFNAPLAGAFYGFELILGMYTVNAISQVAVAALSASLVARLLSSGEPIFALPLDSGVVPNWYYLLFVLQGIGAAGIGIVSMIAVTRCEQAARSLALPEWLRPIFGGLLIGGIAIACPQVLGSGQGAISEHLHQSWPIWVLIGMLVAKIAGSAISLGSGFYGGMFYTSLFIGCLFGQISGLFFGHFLPAGAEHQDIFILVGMGAVAASIVGAPVTMVLLVLEMTSNFSATTSVLMGVLIASAITRHFFGYSFSTWRFHLRGLRIHGAHDIGWVQEITVASLMRHECPTIDAQATLETIRERAVLRHSKRLFVIDAQQQYQGVIDGNNLPETDTETAPPLAAELAAQPERFLLPAQNIQQALHAFTAWETEELPVLESEQSRRVIGYLSEGFALRRYAHELETRNLAKLGTLNPQT